MKCLTCNKQITGKYQDAFCGGYENYCYKCGEQKAYADYHEFEREQFEAELESANPNFSDLYEIGEEYI